MSLALASELDWDAALVWVDERQEYGELRMIALAGFVLRSLCGPSAGPQNHQFAQSQ